MRVRGGMAHVWGARGVIIGAMAGLSACVSGPRPTVGVSSSVGGTMRPYEVNGVRYTPHADPHYNAVGIATWYGYPYHKRTTADGELFDMDKASAAHTTLPLPCIVEVTNLENGRRIRVRVNDRGPFVRGRIIDLSREAAKELGFYVQGSTRVRVRYLGPAPLAGGGSLQLASVRPEEPPAQPRTVRASYAPADAAGAKTSATPDSSLSAGNAADPMVWGGDAAIPAAPTLVASAPDGEGDIPAAEPTVSPTEPVSTSVLAPATTEASTETAPANPPTLAPSSSGLVSRAVRLQAGAFADPERARAAANALGRWGQVNLEPVTRGSQTLWRVILTGPPGEDAATLATDLAQAGFAGARVLGAN